MFWMRGALSWWGWCFDLDIGAQRGRPTLNADGYPAWMPGVHAHALALAGRGKDELQQMVRTRMRERFHPEALTKLQAAGPDTFSYDKVLNLLVEKEIHFGEISRLDCSRSAFIVLCAWSVTAAFNLAARGRTSNMRISWNKREFKNICVDVASFV